jgi:dolichol-phosphate mannosyltransferase
VNTSIVIIPTYNEKENIEPIIRAVFSQKVAFDILIVDDSSPDGTADIVRRLQNEFSGRLHLEVRQGKQGLGTAYIHGFKWALAKEYDYIFEMDADFSHNPADLERLLLACTERGAQLSIGSRYVKDGKVENWPLERRLMSYFASVYVRIVLGISIRDTTAGFVCYHKSALAKIDLDNVKFLGYAFQIEMKYRAIKKLVPIIEVPITFKDRVLGHSKMSVKIFQEAFWGVIKMRWIK